ncbi:MAG: hypothetical protein LUC86_07985 [Prevotellaceae bacterium]|nr:hypothetical protein [Prevotellaceae bacterium]
MKRELSMAELFNGIWKEAQKESQEGICERTITRLIKMMVDSKFLDKPRYGYYSLHDEDEDGIVQDELPFDLPDEQEDQESQEDGINQDGYDDGLPY